MSAENNDAYTDPYDALTGRIMAIHDVREIDAQLVDNGPMVEGRTFQAPRHWMVTDIGLLECAITYGDAPNVAPNISTTVTAWPDVRDVEIESEVALIEQGSDSTDNPYAYSYRVHLLVQFPRIDLVTMSIDESFELAHFGAAMNRRMNR